MREQESDASEDGMEGYDHLPDGSIVAPDRQEDAGFGGKNGKREKKLQ